MEEDGLTVALSPVQLAAVLRGEDISETDTLANRLWGGANVVFGVFELVGAGALLLTPEPTMATKVGGSALGVHGVDTFQTGLRQAWTGRTEESFTHRGAEALAIALGADEATASRIGTGIDIAVPIVVSLGVGAARVLAIRGGRIALIEHEAAAGSRVGGHTIARHIGKSEAELRARLAAERIPVASTFKSLTLAERVLYKALQQNRTAIEAWARTAQVNDKLVLNFVGNEVIGHGVVRSSGLLAQFMNARVVLKMGSYGGKPYYILTAFPVP